jgi:LmbE family N-acetylglucosaminyl deacetylase
MRPPPPLQGAVVVVSPHCDDALLSLGAVLAGRRPADGTTTVLTVLAGAPRSSAPAGDWDRRSGFATAAAATRARRAEDTRACGRLNATPVHLDGTDEQYEDVLDDDALWRAAEPFLSSADEVLLPGFPLRHLDHRRVTSLVLQRLEPAQSVRLYIEEPYATWVRASLSPPADPWGGAAVWGTVPTARRHLARWMLAIPCYRSQLRPLGSYLARRQTTPLRRVLGARPAALLLELARSAVLRGQPLTAPVSVGRLQAALPL